MLDYLGYAFIIFIGLVVLSVINVFYFHIKCAKFAKEEILHLLLKTSNDSLNEFNKKNELLIRGVKQKTKKHISQILKNENFLEYLNKETELQDKLKEYIVDTVFIKNLIQELIVCCDGSSNPNISDDLLTDIQKDIEKSMKSIIIDENTLWMKTTNMDIAKIFVEYRKNQNILNKEPEYKNISENLKLFKEIIFSDDEQKINKFIDYEFNNAASLRTSKRAFINRNFNNDKTKQKNQIPAWGNAFVQVYSNWTRF